MINLIWLLATIAAYATIWHVSARINCHIPLSTKRTPTGLVPFPNRPPNTVNPVSTHDYLGDHAFGFPFRGMLPKIHGEDVLGAVPEISQR